MKRSMLSASAALIMSACTPAVVRASDARLSAQASTPQGNFTFNCNPVLDARQRGVTLTLREKNALSCLSADSRATLTVVVIPAPPGPGSVTVNVAPDGQPPVYRNVPVPPRVEGAATYVLLLVSGPVGAPPLTYFGEARETDVGSFNLITRAGLQGKFRASLDGGVSVQGSYNLVGER